MLRRNRETPCNELVIVIKYGFSLSKPLFEPHAQSCQQASDLQIDYQIRDDTSLKLIFFTPN